MKILAKQNRELIMTNVQNTQNENDAEKITLQVPEQYENFNKKIVFVTPDGNVWDIITNNEYLIPKAITKYKQVDLYIWLTKGDVDFRSQTRTLKFYHNEDASDEITPEEISGVNTVINLLEEEITKVNNLETEIDGKLEEIDTAIENIHTAIQETENLDLDAEKVGQTTTVTLTKKDGTVKTIHIDDGVDLQFMWQGTSLGIKTAEQEEYTFVDLQGIQGEKGEKGDTGTYDDTELKNDISKIKEEQTTQNGNISKNADEITNLKNENSYLQNVVKQAFTEKIASGTELNIDNTIEARMEMKLNGNTSQNGEPTPATPQEIHCVKGNNVIKVSNGSEETEHKLNLGNIELNAIEDFKDYFKKEKNKWYKVENIGSYTFKGNEDFHFAEVGTINQRFDIQTSALNISSRQEFKYKLFTHFRMAYSNSGIWGEYYMSSDWIVIKDNDNIMTSLEDFKAWLSANKPTIYYVRTSAIDIEITDTTLINQLDEISQALSKKGTTIISQNNDDLPFNLDVIALTK